MTGRDGESFDNRGDVIKKASQTRFAAGGSIASILDKEDVDSEGREISGKLREAVSYHFSISMEMHKRKGGGVRGDIGARKTCLVAIHPKDIRRRLTSREEVPSTQCRMVENGSRRLLFGVGRKVLDDDSRVTDRISCKRGSVPPGHCGAQSLSRLADGKWERRCLLKLTEMLHCIPAPRRGRKTRQPRLGCKGHGAPGTDPRLAFIGVLPRGLGCGEFLFDQSRIGHEARSFQKMIPALLQPISPHTKASDPVFLSRLLFQTLGNPDFDD